jgi:hypothetical protein
MRTACLDIITPLVRLIHISPCHDVPIADLYSCMASIPSNTPKCRWFYATKECHDAVIKMVLNSCLLQPESHFTREYDECGK